MGDMKNPRDVINKAAWTLLESSRDSAAVNITMALRQGKLEVKPEHVPVLMSLINASIEEGYHKGFRVFTRTVDAALPASEPPKPAKKKSP
jgi:hypothetical protein